jgi:MSHA biogenesis protein MshK
MAEPLSVATMKILRKSMRQAGLALTMLLAAAGGGAEDLPDPMRPPASIAPWNETGASAIPSGPVLQSVLISPRRTVAIISGQTVRLGDKYGDAKVTAIREGEVDLRSGKNIQTLKLFPGIEKRLTSGRVNNKSDRLAQ